MIERYQTKAMKEIWSEEKKIEMWLQVELAVCEKIYRKKEIKKKEFESIQKTVKALIPVKKEFLSEILEEEKITRHDVVAFINVMGKKLKGHAASFHLGLTSSDILDTALALRMEMAGKIIVGDIQQLLKALKKIALKYKFQETIGRTHGRYAEPTTLGLKFLGYFCEWQRNLKRLDLALSSLKYGKISGPVGNCAYWDLGFEKQVLKKLGLKREPVATQVVPRDRHAELLSLFALMGSSLERLAIELRHLQRSEVAEVEEGFFKGQRGSSAMPHKKNPISSENISGLARLLRSYGQAAFENIPLWHERDMSHSSVERVIIPDSFSLMSYSLKRMTTVLSELQFNKENILKNLNEAKTQSFSGKILTALVKKGFSREEAYQLVQSKAFSKEGLKYSEIEKYISPYELHSIFQQKINQQVIAKIYKEVL